MIIKKKEDFSEIKRKKKVDFWRRIEKINNKRRKSQRRRKE